MNNSEQSNFEEGHQLMHNLEEILSECTSCKIDCTNQSQFQWSTILDEIVKKLDVAKFTNQTSISDRLHKCLTNTNVRKSIDSYLTTFKEKRCTCGQKDVDKVRSLYDRGVKFLKEAEFLEDEKFLKIALAIFTSALMFAPEGSLEAEVIYVRRTEANNKLRQFENALEDIERSLVIAKANDTDDQGEDEDEEDVKIRKTSFGMLIASKAFTLINLGRWFDAKTLQENVEKEEKKKQKGKRKQKMNPTAVPSIVPDDATEEGNLWNSLKEMTKSATSSQPKGLPTLNLKQGQDLDSVAKALKEKRLFLPHPKYPWLSSKVDLRYDKAQGRHYLITSRKIPFAEVVAVERSFATLALGEVGHRRCHHCHASFYKSTTLKLSKDVINAVQGQCSGKIKFYIPVACRRCSNVLFCSEQCHTDAWEAYHRFECDHLSILGCVDRSAHMALRMLYSAGEWTKLKATINRLEAKNEPFGRILNPNEYSFLYQVMPLEALEDEEQLRQLITVCLLVKLAEESGYLPSNSPKADRKLVGRLLQRHLAQLKVNQHNLVQTKQFDLYEQQPENSDSFQIVSGVASLLGGTASSAGNVLLRPYSQTNMMQSAVNIYAASSDIRVGTRLAIADLDDTMKRYNSEQLKSLAFELKLFDFGWQSGPSTSGQH